MNVPNAIKIAAAALLSAGILAPIAASAAPPTGGAPAPKPAKTSGQTAPAAPPATTATGAQPPPPAPQTQPNPQGGAAPYPYPYPYPYPPPPYPYPYPYPPPPGAAPPGSVPPGSDAAKPPRPDAQKEGNKRRLGIGLSTGGYFAPGRFAVTSGGILDLELTWRLPLPSFQRLDVGLEGRYLRTTEATQSGIGVPIRYAARMGRHAEVEASLVPFYSRVAFDSSYFKPANGFGARIRVGFGFPIVPSFSLGVNPIAFSLMGSSNVRMLFTYEPSFWLRFALLDGESKKPAASEEPVEKTP